MTIYHTYAKRQVNKSMFLLGSLIILMKVASCYIILLLNVILITAVNYGIFVQILILLRLKKYKNVFFYVSLVNTNTYEELLQIFYKSPLYIIILRKIVELTYMISIINVHLILEV